MVYPNHPDRPRPRRAGRLPRRAVDARRWPLASIGVVSLVALSGCAGGDIEEPQTTPPPTQVTSQVEPPPPPPPLPPPIREVRATGSRSKVTVIDAGLEAQKPTTLIEASRLAKARKRQQAPQAPIAEINDDNLAEYAEGAEVIVLESAPAGQLTDEATADTAAPALDPTVPDGVRDEDFWRNRALELRMGWRRAVDELAELELESAALRQQFYAEDDPYIRDSQVKPAWDRVLDRMNALREQAGRFEGELDSFLDEGRREGALQGWLNQGWELEPTAEERQLVEQVSFGTRGGEPTQREPSGN
ncbi:MAG: hypothetical protein AAGM22_24595 [Acidobacteriota bacterium]